MPVRCADSYNTTASLLFLAFDNRNDNTKVFNNNSRILAIKPSGNVFAAEAVEELNYKAKSWNDLLTGEDFTKRVRNLFLAGSCIKGAWNLHS